MQPPSPLIFVSQPFLWRKREIKIEEGKYENCGGGGKLRRMTLNEEGK